MADFISREAAIRKRHGCNRDCSACDFAADGDSWCEGELFVVDIMRVPAADVRPVVRGKWEKGGGSVFPMYVCSLCHAISLGGNFCPNCGADMDGNENG